MKQIAICVCIILLAVTNSYAADKYFGDKALIDRVIKSKNITDIPPQDISERERLNFEFEICARLLKIIKANPENNDAWEALHHFRSLTDAGLTESFFDDCFDAIKTNPLIYYNRYVKFGDSKALSRIEDAIRGYLIDDNGNIHKEEAENRKYIEKMISLVRQQPTDTYSQMRHSEFLNFVEEKYELRKRDFQQYFGN